MNFEALRAANIARQAEWSGNEKLDIAFRALEVADEVGEVTGAIKKYIRAQRGVCGQAKTAEDIANEIGDAIISLDLLAQQLGDEMPEMPYIPVAADDLAQAGLKLDVSTGRLSAQVLDVLWSEQGSDTYIGARIAVRVEVRIVLCGLVSIARALDIDIEKAVTQKFNLTSEKYGLGTRMAA